MKLIRFELKAEPGFARSGVVHMGRVYETEDGEAKSIHHAPDIRPLTPVANARSVRFFSQALDESGESPFLYANPAAMVGPSQSLLMPPSHGALRLEPYLAAVLVGHGYRVAQGDAEGLVLGYSLILAASLNLSDGRRFDAGFALGPVITTPDELNDYSIDEGDGERYSLDILLKVNGVDRGDGRTDELPLSLAHAISAASQTCPVGQGDVIAVGPLVAPVNFDPGDEASLSVEGLGTLSVKLSLDP